MFDRSPKSRVIPHAASPAPRSPAPQAASFGPSAPHNLTKLLQHPPRDRVAKRSNHIGLPEPLKARVEALSGVAMDDVRVRYRSPEPARHGALAYARGTEIHLGPGQENRLPHETWHVAQQARGQVKPIARSDLPVNEDSSLEREAANMSTRILEGPIAPRTSSLTLWASHSAFAPMQFDKGDRSKIRHGSASDDPRPPAALAAPMIENINDLPSRYQNHPDFLRLFKEVDLADSKIERSPNSSKTTYVANKGSTGKRIREILAAIEFAEKNNIDTSRISRSEGYYDFDVGNHKIDPFQLPGQVGGQPDKKAVKAFYKYPSGTYNKHTNGGKGGEAGVLGVLDTTYSSQDEVDEMDRNLSSKSIPRGLRYDVRVPLMHEYRKDYEAGSLSEHDKSTKFAKAEIARHNAEEKWKQRQDDLVWKQKQESLNAHRGSDPTKKFGSTDLNQQAKRKKAYDKKRGR